MKHKVQDLIDSGDIVVDSHNKNLDHQAFKDPFPPHEKGESSNAKNTNAKVNYTYTNDENVIGMIEPVGVEYCDVITIKGSDNAPKPKTPFILRSSVSCSSESEQPQDYANVVT